MAQQTGWLPPASLRHALVFTSPLQPARVAGQHGVGPEKRLMMRRRARSRAAMTRDSESGEPFKNYFSSSFLHEIEVALCWISGFRTQI